MDSLPVNEYRTLLEISFVGAVSYFEAFFKDHLAAVLNIAPSLVEQLGKDRPELVLEPAKLVALSGDIRSKLGFLIVEKLDLGTAKKINSAFTATLGETPFSSRDSESFAEHLRNRNLLVRHGGIYTMKHARPLSGEARKSEQPFFGSKQISIEELESLISFCERIAKHVVVSSKNTLQTLDHGGKITIVNRGALELLDYHDFDPIL